MFRNAFLDQADFFYTESVAATFRKWGKEETLRRLVRHVRALRPEVITLHGNGANGNHTSYGSWQFGNAVGGQTLTITDVAGHVISVPANPGNSGKQFPACN